MSGNKCRTPIYSRQRPAAIRPPPRGLVCLRLLSCPRIRRVHCKRVNIPLPSVCTGRTQDKARPSETAEPSPGCFWWEWGHCGRQTPGCLQAGGLLALSGSQTQIMPTPPPPVPQAASASSSLFSLLLILEFAQFPGSGAEGRTGRERLAPPSRSEARRSLCKHLQARVYLTVNRSRAPL